MVEAALIAKRIEALQEWRTSRAGRRARTAVAMHKHTEGELPSETEGLPEARRSQVIELSDGDEFNLEIAPIRKQIGDSIVRMLAYNGSVPGPMLKVPRMRRSRFTSRTAVTSMQPCTGTAYASEPIRQHARDAGADPGRRDLYLPGDRARSGRVLVPPAHP